jgi:DNA-binding GntR family transcriptional regulator
VSKEELTDLLALPQKRSLAEDVVDRLREAICSGKLAPDAKLREEMLADFLKVSRGPIREALVQLEREGLVIKQPNRGATVARLSREDLDEVYSLRVAIETFAISEVIRKGEPRHLDDMQAVVNAMSAAVDHGISAQEAARLDIQFHDILYQAAKHKRLYECWSTLKPQIHIFLLSRNVANPDFRELIISGHQEILDAIRSHDEARALTLIREHLRQAYERIVTSYTKES